MRLRAAVEDDIAPLLRMWDMYRYGPGSLGSAVQAGWGAAGAVFGASCSLFICVAALLALLVYPNCVYGLPRLVAGPFSSLGARAGHARAVDAAERQAEAAFERQEAAYKEAQATATTCLRRLALCTARPRRPHTVQCCGAVRCHRRNGCLHTRVGVWGTTLRDAGYFAAACALIRVVWLAMLAVPASAALSSIARATAVMDVALKVFDPGYAAPVPTGYWQEHSDTARLYHSRQQLESLRHTVQGLLAATVVQCCLLAAGFAVLSRRLRHLEKACLGLAPETIDAIDAAAAAAPSAEPAAPAVVVSDEGAAEPGPVDEQASANAEVGLLRAPLLGRNRLAADAGGRPLGGPECADGGSGGAAAADP
jgi:hypothetical protein